MGPQPTETEAKIVQLAPNAKMAGSSAGELYGAILQELQTMRKQSGGDPVQVTKSLLLRLQTNELVTSREHEQLGKVADLLFAQARGEIGAAEVAVQVRSLYQAMLADKSSSQTALSIMSIVADSSVTSVLRSVALPKEGEQPAQDGGVLFASEEVTTALIFGGAIAGAIAGDIIGGPLGGAVGAIVGGLAGLIGSIFA
jgi:uncharacterized membrane protein